MRDILKHTESFVPKALDEHGNPDIHALFRSFQDAAVSHAEELGIGKSFYVPNNLLFVLCRMKLVLLEDFDFSKEYSLSTYALPPERIQFYRDAYIEDEKGKRFALIRSLWVLISGANRRIVTTDRLSRQLAPLSEEMEKLPPVLAGRLSALEEIPETTLIGEHVVVPEDIDGNGHMNNTVYIRLAQEAGFPAKVKSFEIDFEKECLLGDRLSIYKGKDGYVCGMKDGQLSFKVKTEFRF